MSVLVTGGAGYIGSVTVETLIEAGYRVVVLDNLSMGHRSAVHPDAAFIEGDLADAETLRRLFAQHEIEGVFHFASHTLVGESMERPFLYLSDNIRNALNLLEAMEEAGVRKFVLSSTANLFDRPDRIPIRENEQTIPGSPYGESKAIIERLLHWLNRTRGLKYAALRYFNAAGASPRWGEDHTPETHLIPLILQVALGQREAFTIYGDDYGTEDGTCVRDFVHVADLAQAHLKAFRALEHQDVLTYNLGNGQGFSVREVIRMARDVTGQKIKTKVAARRPGDPAVLVADSTHIRKQLDWRPAFASLGSILESAWKWHLRHPHGYAE